MEVPTPKTPTHTTSRDDRLRIQTLYYTAGWTIANLRQQFHHLSARQLDYALDSRPTPQFHRSGRHPLLNTPQRKQLVAWAATSAETRDVPWAEIPKWLGWSCSSYAIRTAFEREGYVRAVRRKVPPLSEKNRLARLA